MEKGTTYRVRPRMQPRKRSRSVRFISTGSRQLLVGAGVLFPLGADEGPVLDPGHVGRVRTRPVAVRSLGIGKPLERAGRDQPGAQVVVLLGAAVAPQHLVGLGEGGPLVDPRQQTRGGSVRGLVEVTAGHFSFSLPVLLPTLPCG